MKTAEELMTRYGYSREDAEQYVKRAACEHDFGKLCYGSFLGCFRKCEKCGQQICLSRNCWEHAPKLGEDGAR